jgi:hypothetical protein
MLTPATLFASLLSLCDHLVGQKLFAWHHPGFSAQVACGLQAAPDRSRTNLSLGSGSASSMSAVPPRSGGPPTKHVGDAQQDFVVR